MDVLREPEYFERQAESIASLLFFVTYVVSAIMAFGALFAALNTMYSAVSARTVEIATLRALGFGATGVVVSVLAEALLLALLGGVAGAAISWVVFSGDTISLGGGQGSLIAELRRRPPSSARVSLGHARSECSARCFRRFKPRDCPWLRRCGRSERRRRGACQGLASLAASGCGPYIAIFSSRHSCARLPAAASSALAIRIRRASIARLASSSIRTSFIE